MALNYVWIVLILIGFVVATLKSILYKNYQIFNEILTGIFDSASLSFEICLGLAGIMTLWMGIMNVGKEAGLINVIAKILSPVFKVIFPSIPSGHKSIGSMSMNFSANMLGLDNAATPLGLKAMDDLQEINEENEIASNAQIMFLALNTAGVTLVPTSVIAIRQTMAMEQNISGFNGADIFLPTLIVTFLSFLVAMLTVAYFQKINIFKMPILILVGILLGLIFGLYALTTSLPVESIEGVVSSIGSFMILAIVILFIGWGVFKKINVYDSFIEGAKGGFDVVITIVPYLVAMLFAISIFRNSGCLDFILEGMKFIFSSTGCDTRFVDALPVGLMKPLSGSGARGVLVDVMNTHGVNSFVSKVASIMQGGTETTFYVLAVYFGSVGIKNTRNALICGLIADFAAVVIAILVGYLFYG